MTDQLPPEALEADPEGVPEHTMNAFTGPGGPEGDIEDADGAPDGSESMGIGPLVLGPDERFEPPPANRIEVVGLDLEGGTP